MRHAILFYILVAITIPTSSLAAQPPASFSAAQSVMATSSSPGNAYAAGSTVVLTAPVEGDFSAFGGSIITAATVSGDQLLAAGTIRSRARAGGDIRAVGGRITIDQPIAGDLIAFGYSVTDIGRVGGSVLVAAANTTIANGAEGQVTIYGNNVALGGNFEKNVRIVSSGRVSIAPNVVIKGKLVYEAPEMANIPKTATIAGGVEYTNASYLPNVGTSRVLALINMGFFIFVRILGALLLAGLLAGLFPGPARALVDRAFSGRLRDILLAMLLGFAICVATPILILLLLLTFVGSGLALFILVGYALLFMLSLLYAGIFLGSSIARRYEKRDTIVWRDGVVGTLILSIVALIPTIGGILIFLFMIFVAGSLLQIFYSFAFPRDERMRELV